MVHCDHCGTDAFHVWRRRERTETMTHRTTVWVCRDCHPDLSTAGETSGTTAKAVTDGGRRSGR